MRSKPLFLLLSVTRSCISDIDTDRSAGVELDMVTLTAFLFLLFLARTPMGCSYKCNYLVYIKVRFWHEATKYQCCQRISCSKVLNVDISGFVEY